MFKLVSLALVALAAVSAVHAGPIAVRNTPPSGWIASILEPYDDYHTRYLAIGCKEKHNTQFFDDCCHPMKKGETLEKNRKPYCRPGANPPPSSSHLPVNTLVSKPKPTTTTTSEPEPTYTPDDGDDCEDDNDDDNNDDEDDDCDDDNEPPSPDPTTPTPTPTYTPTPTTTPAPAPKPPKTTTSPPKPSPTPDTDTPPSSSSETHTGGVVTWFTQNGNAGACGEKHSDNDFIAALDYRTYGNTSAKSSYCGKKIKITWQGKSVVATVEDACPTCVNAGSVDLSLAAFKALAPLDVGELKDITWQLL